MKKYFIFTVVLTILSPLQAAPLNLVSALDYCLVRCHEHIQALESDHVSTHSTFIDDQRMHYAYHISMLYELKKSIKVKQCYSMQDQKVLTKIIASLTETPNVDLQAYKQVINIYNDKQRCSYKKTLPYFHTLKRLTPRVFKASLVLGCLCALYVYRSKIVESFDHLKNFNRDFIQAIKNIYNLYQKSSPVIRYNPDLIPESLPQEQTTRSYYLVIKEAYCCQKGILYNNMDPESKRSLKQKILNHAQKGTLPKALMKAWSKMTIYDLILPGKKASPIVKAWMEYWLLNIANPICSTYNYVYHNMPYFSNAKQVIKACAYLGTIPFALYAYRGAKNLLKPRVIQLLYVNQLLHRMQKILIENMHHQCLSNVDKGMLYHYAWSIQKESKKYLSKIDYTTFMNDVHKILHDAYSVQQKRAIIKLMQQEYEFLKH